MTAKALVVRFPNGDFAYEIRSRGAPEVGETIRRRGALWKVTTRDTRDVVVTIQVEAVDERSSGTPDTPIDGAT